MGGKRGFMTGVDNGDAVLPEDPPHDDPRRKFYDKVKTRARSNMANEMRKSVAPPPEATPPAPAPEPAAAPVEITAEQIRAVLEAMNQHPPVVDPVESIKSEPPEEPGPSIAGAKPGQGIGGGDYLAKGDEPEEPGPSLAGANPTNGTIDPGDLNPVEDDEEELLKLALGA